MKLSFQATCLASALFSLACLAPAASAQTLTHLTLTQVYGGGGATTGTPTFNQDYFEIFNPTGSTVNLGGLSIQYATATGSLTAFASAYVLPSYNLLPGHFYLVGGATSGTYLGAAVTPTPDSAITLNAGATSGNVGLVMGTAAVSCTDPSVLDKLGYGTSTGTACAEGTRATAPSTTLALKRANPCADLNANSTDFSTVTPAPRSSATASLGSCYASKVTAATTLTATGFPTLTAQGAAHTITVTVTDANGYNVTNFTGSVTVTSTDPLAAPATQTYNFTAADEGVHAFTLALGTAGTQSITASSSGLTSSTESGITVTGDVYIVNSDGTVARLNTAGTVLNTAGSANGTATAGGIAIGDQGYTASVVNSNPQVFITSPDLSGFTEQATGDGLFAPTAVIFDGDSCIWVTNGNNTISQFGGSDGGSPSTGYTGGALNAPSSIAIDSTGSLWVTNSGSASITRFFGLAAPVLTPTVTSVTRGTTAATTGTPGVRP